LLIVTVPNLSSNNTNTTRTTNSTNSSTNTTVANPSSTPDLSSLLNLPHFQGLISLAQTNPALFNQLTNSTYFDVPSTNNALKPYVILEEPKSDLSSLIATSAPVIGGDTSLKVNAAAAAAAPTTAEDLENSLKSLANELGFESNGGDNGLVDYVNMDDFLSTYSKLLPEELL
jgi:hypothetical protein